MVYIVTNVFFIAFNTPSTIMARDRAGNLLVVNMGFLFLSHHLGFLADAIGVSLIACKRIHRAVGWLAGVLLILHTIMAL